MNEGEFESPYGGYDVLKKRHTPSWDELTRKVVDERLRQVPPRRFFDAPEWIVLEALCDRLVPQADRPSDPVPLAAWIDDKLSRGEGDGYRYADMPPDATAWRMGLRGIEAESRTQFERSFAALSSDEQDNVLDRIRRDNVSGSCWAGLSPSRFFNAALKEVVGVYYAHPAAWSEIGFGGPASPRGYARLAMNEVDPWEARQSPGSGTAGE